MVEQIVACEGPAENEATDDKENAHADVAAAEKCEQPRVPGLRTERYAALCSYLRAEMKKHHKRNGNEAKTVDFRDPRRTRGDAPQAKPS